MASILLFVARSDNRLDIVFAKMDGLRSISRKTNWGEISRSYIPPMRQACLKMLSQL